MVTPFTKKGDTRKRGGVVPEGGFQDGRDPSRLWLEKKHPNNTEGGEGKGETQGQEEGHAAGPWEGMKDVIQSPCPQGSALLRTERARPVPRTRYGGRMQREAMICLRDRATSLGDGPGLDFWAEESWGSVRPSS